MKSVILLLCLLCFAPLVIDAAGYKHKSEAEIARMMPAERVDEFANEQAYHKYDFLDNHSVLITKYIRLDGLRALPRIIEIIDEYDPAHASGRSGRKGERFDGAWMMLGDLDNHVVRLRASEEGRRAIDALKRAIERMRAAGHGKPDQQKWSENGRVRLAEMDLEEAGAINGGDYAIRDTFWVQYKIQMSDQELLELSNYLVARDSTYPSWSETDFIKDYTRLNKAQLPFQVYVMKKPERYYQAYLEFKNTKS